MKKHQPQKSTPTNSNNKIMGKGKNYQSGNNQGMEDCYSRKADKALCYPTKGEPNYSKGELEGNQSGYASTFKPAAPLSNAKPQDFPH